MDVEKTLETNKRQKDFYNSAGSAKNNLPTRMWSKLRNGLLSDFRKQFDIKDRVYDQHREWLGDLSRKKSFGLRLSKRKCAVNLYGQKC